MPTEDGRTRVILAVCTYQRNEPLRCLLNAMLDCAGRVSGSAAVGVVVVDDTADGKARDVAESFADRFELGLTYCISGKANISIARNLAMETAMAQADWIAMTDDDCEPVPEWTEAQLDVQRRTGADTVTGIMVGRPPPGSPRWIVDQPFLEFGEVQADDGAPLTTAYTNNSLMSAEWLREHPDVRFDPALGRIGGEDMVFFRTARDRGMRIHFSRAGFVYENEPAERITLSYQLRRALWNGNTSYVTSIRDGVRPLRLLVHGVASFARALLRPVRQLFKGSPLQLRYALFLMLRAAGVVLGVVGVKLNHH